MFVHMYTDECHYSIELIQSSRNIVSLSFLLTRLKVLIPPQILQTLHKCMPLLTSPKRYSAIASCEIFLRITSYITIHNYLQLPEMCSSIFSNASPYQYLHVHHPMYSGYHATGSELITILCVRLAITPPPPTTTFHHLEWLCRNGRS